MKSLLYLSILVFVFSPSWMAASTERWEELTSGKNAEFLDTVPRQFQGKYMLLQISRNDEEWVDVGDKNIHYMTVGESEAVEFINNSKRKVKKVAVGKDKNGAPMAVLLMNDNTVLNIRIWNQENNLVIISGDYKDQNGKINIAWMRCWLTK
jgi:hypothetical protein